MKKKTLIIMLALAMATTAMLAGCGETSLATSTSDTVSSEISTEATEPTLSETDKAVIDSGLSVDDNGNIVDKDGKKVKATKDGKVKVKTDDGKEVEVSTENVKSAKNNEKKVDEAKTSSNSNNNSSSNKKNSSSSSKSNNSSSKSSSNSSKSNKSSDSSTSSKNNSGSSKTDSGSSSKSDEHAGKKYYEAQYKTIEHPAEYKNVKVIDEEAYSYEVAQYEEEDHIICNVCGADITGNKTPHLRAHALADEGSGWHVTTTDVFIGYKTINVPEKSHTEKQLVKEAWTEKVLVRAAGWY